VTAMDEEREIKEFIQAGLRGVGLDEARKLSLRHTLAAELRREKKAWTGRAANKIHDFWETTYEISLVPVAAAVVVLGVFCGSLVYPPSIKTEPYPAPRYFTRQVRSGADGAPQVIYIPVE